MILPEKLISNKLTQIESHRFFLTFSLLLVSVCCELLNIKKSRTAEKSVATICDSLFYDLPGIFHRREFEKADTRNSLKLSSVWLTLTLTFLSSVNSPFLPTSYICYHNLLIMESHALFLSKRFFFSVCFRQIHPLYNLQQLLLFWEKLTGQQNLNLLKKKKGLWQTSH